MSAIETRPIESLNGKVHRVLFWDSRKSFSVALVRFFHNTSGGKSTLGKVVHTGNRVEAGQSVICRGRWQMGTQGWEFRADQVSATDDAVAPTEDELDERNIVAGYLHACKIPGLGRVGCLKLAETFGDNVIDILSRQPGEVQRVLACSYPRASSICEAWRQSETEHRIMLDLLRYGLGRAQAAAIYEKHGTASPAYVRQNPYAIAGDTKGLGFKTADRVSQRMGVRKDDVERVVAGVRQVIQDAEGAGHTCLPALDLEAKAADLLGIEAALVREALERAIGEGDLVEFEGQRGRLIQSPRMAWHESGIANLMQMRAERESETLRVRHEVEQMIAGQSMLDESQIAAIRTMDARHTVMLLGGPGTGKTTLNRYYLPTLNSAQMTLCATTGKAARRMREVVGQNVSTVHSACGFNPVTARFDRNENNPISTASVKVDESSMLDVTMMHALLRATPLDATMTLIGDPNQLRSVGPGAILEDFIDAGVARAELQEPHRLGGAGEGITDFIYGLLKGHVNLGESIHDDALLLEVERDEDVPKQLLALMLRTLPSIGFDPMRDVQVLTPKNEGPTGTKRLNKLLQDALNPSPPMEKSSFRLGDRVMYTRNSKEKQVFNGDVGEILSESGRGVLTSFYGTPLEFEKRQMGGFELAYAMTVHKSQGSEWPVVVLPLVRSDAYMLDRRILFTAASRAKAKCIVIARKGTLYSTVKRDPNKRRETTLLDRLRAK